MFESDIWILFNNNYFLSGIFLVFLIKYFLVFGEGYYKHNQILYKKLFKEIAIGFLFISFFTLFLVTSVKNPTFNIFFKYFLGSSIFLIFILKLYDGEAKTYRYNVFQSISIANLYIPIFILTWFVGGSILFFTIIFIFLLLLTYSLRFDRNWIENIFYIFYILIFLFSTITLNDIMFDSIYLTNSLLFQMDLGIFLLGGIFGYLYFISGFYIIFLITYLPIKDIKYFNRMKIRTQFVTEIFYNDYSLKWTYLYLCVLFVFFTLNSIYNFADLFLLLNLFFLTNILISYIRNYNLKKDFKIE